MLPESRYILLEANYGRAFYIDDSMVASWSETEPEEHVWEQIYRRIGPGERVVRFKWNKNSFPRTLSRPVRFKWNKNSFPRTLSRPAKT